MEKLVTQVHAMGQILRSRGGRQELGPRVRTGFASAAGSRPENEDYLGIAEGETAQLPVRGMVLAVADGMSGGKGGRVAAELLVRGFLDGYFGCPESLPLERAAGQALSAVNRWIHAQGQRDEALRGMGSTFTALILRGRQGFMVHVGDSRLYRFRGGELVQLSHDHRMSLGIGTVLSRAVGLEEGVRADFREIDVQPYDRFLLCTDGIHKALSARVIRDHLENYGDGPAAAAQLVHSATVRTGADNASAIVADVVSLPLVDERYLERVLGELPVAEPPKAGDVVDGFRLDRLIYKGHYSCVFDGVDTIDRRRVAIKFPHPRVATDANVKRGFVREAWVTSQVSSAWIAQVIPVAESRQTRMYSVMPFYEGETLERRLKKRPMALDEGIEIAVGLARAVDALNRRGIVHRDVKPENVLLQKGGGLKLLDLGLCHVPGVPGDTVQDVPGTPSFMAPELLDGSVGDGRSEVFAFAVTLYVMYSGGRFPYGLRRRTPLSRYRSDLPAWLDDILEKGMENDPRERFDDVLEMVHAIEHARMAGTWSIRRRRSLYGRNPVAVWQAVSAVLAMGALILGWFVVHGR